MLTASKIPVPEPIAPIKSAKMVRAPIHIPPNKAAVGIYLKLISNKIPIQLIIDVFLIFPNTS